jgi:hypothetical protein
MRIRIPHDLKEQIEEASYQNRRSMNAEIVARLKASFASEAEAQRQDEDERLAEMISEMFEVKMNEMLERMGK